MAKDDSIAWDGAPDPHAKLFVPIYSPQVGQRMALIVLAGPMMGVHTHWDGMRTIPCMGAPEQCMWCREGQGTRWKGYLPCLAVRSGRLVLAELTLAALAANYHLLVTNPPVLRGWRLALSRRGKRKNSPVVADFSPPPLLVEDLPAPFDVQAALMRIWGRTRAIPQVGLPSQDSLG